MWIRRRSDRPNKRGPVRPPVFPGPILYGLLLSTPLFAQDSIAPLYRDYRVDTLVNLTALHGGQDMEDWPSTVNKQCIYYCSEFYSPTDSFKIWTYDLPSQTANTLVCLPVQPKIKPQYVHDLAATDSTLSLLLDRHLIHYKLQDGAFYSCSIIPLKKRQQRWTDMLGVSQGVLHLLRWQQPYGVKGRMAISRVDPHSKHMDLLSYRTDIKGGLIDLDNHGRYIQLTDSFLATAHVYSYTIEVKNLASGSTDTLSPKLEVWNQHARDRSEGLYAQFRIKNTYESLESFLQFAQDSVDFVHSIYFNTDTSLMVEYQINTDTARIRMQLDVWCYGPQGWLLQDRYSLSDQTRDLTTVLTAENYTYLPLYNKRWLATEKYICYMHCYPKAQINASRKEIIPLFNEPEPANPPYFLVILKKK